MSDDFDGCECVWSQEYAMQRIINFIRQNQNACTDTECFDVSGRPSQQVQATGRGDSGFTVAMIFLIVAMFMYILNPSTWGNLTSSNKRAGGRRDNNQDGSGPPPQPPPPAIN